MDSRHNLGKDAAPGHPSTSVHTETTSVRSNFLEISILKINLLGKRKLSCYE